MLDYTKFLKNNFRFILNYEIVEDNILVHYAKEDDLVIPYTKDAEMFILIMMRNQILDAQSIFENLRKRYNDYDDLVSKYLCAGGFVYSFLEQNAAVFFVALGLLGFNVWQKRYHDVVGVLLEDYDKNKFFIDNEDKYKEYGVDIDINQVHKYTKEELLLKLCYTEGN